MTTKFGIWLVFRKAQMSAKFNSPSSTVALFSEYWGGGGGRIHSSPVIQSEKRPATSGRTILIIIHATLDAEVGCPEGSCLGNKRRKLQLEEF